MSALDLSATKCHPLEMPNCDSKDARLRLDCRTGASVSIFNSRVFVFGGATLELEIPQDFTLETIRSVFKTTLELSANENRHTEYNQYLSAECFRLSLISRKWNHYKTNSSSTLETPPARFFHAMCVYDNYIYISGGINFSNDNKPEVLNDLWRFDSIDRQWKCIYENGNSELLKRYDHIMLMLPNLEMFDKSLIQPGICMVGGVGEDGQYHQALDLFDMSTLKVYEKEHPNLSEFRHSRQGNSEEEHLKIRHSLNAFYPELCSNTNDLRLYGFCKTPDPVEFEPLLVFTNSCKGVRYSHNSNFDISDISSLQFPTIGVFGENILVIGFIANERKLSSYVFNIRTDTWTKLQISCLHKVYTHKLSKGFVWESHHKIAFLGSMSMKDASGSVDYFDNLVVMSLPFTNFFGKKPYTVAQRLRFSNSPSASSLHTLENNSVKRTNSITSANSNLSHVRANPVHGMEHTGDFAGYAYHVAQQMQVNSIKSVLPSYAIAIGKNAFDRNTALSDIDLVCSDGNVVPIPLTLCRRRWGYGFDELFADACAKLHLEQRALNLVESSRNSFSDSCDNDSDDYASIGSKNSLSGPNFRYPFQEKGNKNDPFSIRGGRVRSPSLNESRNNSMTGSLFNPTALNRASISLSQSRRNSSNIGLSRNNSVSYLSPSRRSSLSNSANSRRHSLGGGLQIAQSSSRRGSTLSRSSMLSTSSNSYNSSSSNPLLRQHVNHNSQSNVTIGSSPGCSTSAPISFSPALGAQRSSVTSNNDINNNNEGTDTLHLPPSIKLENIPLQLPMPEVLPDGTPMHNLNPESLSRTLSHISAAEDTFSKKNSLNSMPRSSREEIADMAEQIENSLDMNTKFDPVLLPRSLYLPYPRNTVHAIVEYLYSGQIGANWKLFPTGIELLQATKQLGIPLLYDLILELFFVSLGIMEATLKAKLILILEKENNGQSNGSDEHIYSLLDMKGNDDFDLDWKLLLEAATGSRRDSGSTISSDMKIDDHEQSITSSHGDQMLDLADLGPTDKIEAEACDLSPTNTKFEAASLAATEKVEPKEVPDDTDGHRFRITIGTLDEIGYETTSDSEDGEEDENNEGFLMKSFKKFTLDGSAAKPDAADSRKKLKRWPTFKELVNDENTSFVSETIIQLFLETGVLINDSKLMLQAIHVQQLYRCLREMRSRDKKAQEESAQEEQPLRQQPAERTRDGKLEERTPAGPAGPAGPKDPKGPDAGSTTKPSEKPRNLTVRSAFYEGEGGNGGAGRESGMSSPKNLEVSLPTFDAFPADSSLRKSKSSVSVLSAPTSLLRATESHGSALGALGAVGGIDEALSVRHPSPRRDHLHLPVNNDSNLSVDFPTLNATGSGRSTGVHSDDHSLYSVETRGSDKGDAKKKKKRFFGRFRR